MNEHSTFWVLDSTKLSTYQQCPRQYLFRYLFGWSPSQPSLHLQFGIAWHIAMEHLALHGYEPDQVMEAYDLFRASFGDDYLQFGEDDHPNKNLGNALYGLTEYARRYHTDHAQFSVLATEIAGKVALSDSKHLYFRMDTVCSGSVCDCPPGFFSLERKTGTTNNRVWKDQWLQKTQIGAYNFVLHCLYPEESVCGVCIDGFFPHNPPKRKANGELYAGAKDVEFCRLLLSKTHLQMEDWFTNTLSWYDAIIQDTEETLAFSPDEPVLRTFRKNPEHCTSYFGCPFLDWCHAWPNPIERADEPQAGFIRCYWNPQTLLDGAKKVVEV